MPENGAALIHCQSFQEPKWYFQGNKISSNAGIFLLNNIIMIANVNQSNSGAYTCNGRYSNGSHFTEHATVHVKGCKYLYCHYINNSV